MNKNLFKKNKKGFTLIELLVIIAIIGFLASAAVYSLNSAREEAKYNKCRAELGQIVKAIEIKRDEQNTYLLNITGTGCSDCSCRPYGDEVVMNSSTCINRMTTTFKLLGFPGALRDPWGDLYLIDENEFESFNRCNRDALRSLNCGSIAVPFFTCTE
jgi:prepilin-type N-terminal cleavage/methylation domain-containing protein